MIRVYASEAPELVWLASMLAALKNPHLFADLQGADEWELRAVIEERWKRRCKAR